MQSNARLSLKPAVVLSAYQRTYSSLPHPCTSEPSRPIKGEYDEIEIEAYASESRLSVAGMTPSFQVYTKVERLRIFCVARDFLTPPLTDKKASAQVHRVLTADRVSACQRRQNNDLLGYAWRLATGIGRYDYNGESKWLVVRMPTAVHELIRWRSAFAWSVNQAGFTKIYFPVDSAPPNTKPKHELDVSFWYINAQYPRVIVGVTYSEKGKRLARLTEGFHLDLNARVQIVAGFDTKYGRKGSVKATMPI
ncbi:uncharacterized protein BDR25DRAFT_360220 [Lindgomyces ingoldianus]|uniref:Uncharacterized protein n=1 Tax=Lindgomyces ingoldianus TaxID=673940 RepID=A0ACB6QFJ7_9PLEO|nr:uncharacterized protein BDR25DRAFT_360220 [Lindgomyces ingoldianus]KAF2465699.1 hypothetical protein BDR25DRAFT_360220 [Lindgomyces ingoldianus]